MDAEVVTTSLQSVLMPTSTNSSWPSILNHSSSGTDEDDVFQAVSASQQFYGHQSTELQYADFAQSSAAQTQHQTGGQLGMTPLYNVRNLSPFGQMFLVPNAESTSPIAMAASNSNVVTGNDNMAVSFSQHVSPSAGHVVSSDSHSHFIGFGSNAVSTEHNAVLSGAFSVANSMQGIDASVLSDGRSVTLVQPQNPVVSLGIQQSVKLEQKPNKKSSFPPPPKKPLSPYMRFSKGIWQKVKAENPNSSVCWVGSQIGQIWRELSDSDKQHYIDEFSKDKERYDVEFANYLKLTGLQASDLVKPRAKKKNTKRTAVRTAKQQESHIPSSVAAQQSPVLVQTTTGSKGQPNEMTIMSLGNGQPDRFLISRSDRVQTGGMSSLPPFSQVWSNSDFVANQELANQMLLAAGQLTYNQQQLQQLQRQEQQLRSAEAGAQRISLDGSNRPVVTQYSDSGMASGHQQHAGVQQPTSYANCVTNVVTTGMVSGQPDAKHLSWQHVGVVPQSSQGMQQSNETVPYQFQTNGVGLPAWHNPVGHPQNHPSTTAGGNESDRNHQLLLQADALETQNLILTIQGQYNNTAHALNDDIYRMYQNAVGSREPDQEILKLRADLHEATEQSVHLMRELTTVYAEIHELKDVNDDLRERYRLWHEAHMPVSGSSDADASSGPSGQST